MNNDWKELIDSLASHDVEFLIVGSAALAFYGRPRYTEDIDLWIRRTDENCERLLVALKAYGLPIDGDAISTLAHADRQMIVLGASPQAVDLLNFLDGGNFDDAWGRRSVGELGGLTVNFIGLEDYVRTKRASGRPKDLQDSTCWLRSWVWMAATSFKRQRIITRILVDLQSQNCKFPRPPLGSSPRLSPVFSPIPRPSQRRSCQARPASPPCAPGSP